MGNNRIINYWITHSMSGVHISAAVIAVFLQVLTAVGANPILAKCGTWLFAAGVIHFIVHTNLHRQYHFLLDDRNTRSIPLKQIKCFNRRAIVLYILVSMAVIAAAADFGGLQIAGRLAGLCKFCFYTVIAWFLSNCGLDTGKVPPEYRFGTLRQGRAAQDRETIEVILGYLQVALVIIGIIVIAAIIVSVVRRILSESSPGGSTRKRLSQSSEKLYSGMDTEGRLRIWNNDPNAGIRKMYYKEVRKLNRRRKRLRKDYTPMEIERTVGFPNDSYYLRLHELYEQARYSDMGCTKEDYNSLKELRRKRV